MDSIVTLTFLFLSSLRVFGLGKKSGRDPTTPTGAGGGVLSRDVCGNRKERGTRRWTGVKCPYNSSPLVWVPLVRWAGRP